MRLTVVGCAGSYPGPDSPASCYLLEAAHQGRTYRLVIDLGNGALGVLQQYVALADIDAIAISHLHPDHYMDICGMYVYRKYVPGGPLPRIPLWGPSGSADRFAEAYGLPIDPGMTDELAVQTWVEGEPVNLGPFTVTPRLVDHPVQSYALRIEADGSVLTYSGDTGPTSALVEAADRADVFLCEASFTDDPDNPPHLHLTGTDAGAAATEAHVGRLLLTHVPTWTDHELVASEAKAAFAGPSELVEAGGVYEV
ncbi:MBL fold metallo-hydrolase [Mumia sp. zg.B53]|uniref:MBL fold metallo-hydrolase n=1 Tax=Mumia sp. zg.B53 TaxID=2855449 RepID=UPI001C6DFFDE|nr:MBL fold metallo-hydrolase [Mumia sp. zg.B53]MBW9216030.1 MBL fold metallo-hydrolase [Mumia sp. zg.B53]